MNHRITVRPDGAGHWFQIVDTRTGAIVRTTWAKGSARAARLDAERVVQNIEFFETMSSSARGAA